MVSKISENDLWSHKQATSFPCEKSVQNLNWVTDWSLPCLQGMSVATANLIGFTEKLHHRRKTGHPFCVEKCDPVQSCLAGWKFLFSTTLFHHLIQKMLQCSLKFIRLLRVVFSSQVNNDSK